MPEWLARLLKSPIPVLLDLLNNVWWALGLLFAGLIWAASRLRLWNQCSERHLEDWFYHLEHTDESMRSEAQQKLIACGDRAVLLLVDALQKTDSDKRRELAIDILCEIGIPALRPLLVARKEEIIAPFVDKALEEHLPKVVERRQYEREHASAWKRLWKRIAQSKQIVDELITLLNDTNPIVQEGAALALGQYPWPELVKALGQKLYPTECGTQDVREMVANSLGQTERAEAIPFLEVGLRDPSHNVRIATCQALSQIKQPEAVSALEETLLPLEDPLLRIEAAKALGHIGGVKAMKILDKALQTLPDHDDHREVRTLVGNEYAELQRKLRGEEVT